VWLPVVLVLDEGYGLAELPLFELEWAGADNAGRIGARGTRIGWPVNRGNIFPDVLRHDAKLTKSFCQEDTGRSLGDKLNGVIVDHLVGIENAVDRGLAHAL